MPPQVGSTIELVNSKTGKIKRFKVEYIQKYGTGFILKNTNNTLVLKETN